MNLIGHVRRAVACAALGLRRFHPLAALAVSAATRQIAADPELGSVKVLILTNDEIAGRLVLSPATVKTHVNRAMAKAGARDRAQLVVFAHRTGLIG